jgi:hypothetical protein
LLVYTDMADREGCRPRVVASVHYVPWKTIVSHAQVAQNLVHRRLHRGEIPCGIKEMEREFESRFPLQNSFQYKDLRGDAISLRGIPREFFLTVPRGRYVMDGALLPRGLSGFGTRYYEPAARIPYEDEVGHLPEIDGGLIRYGAQT